ncbi:MAG: hypothetical protein B7X60_00575 [Polynucleobacter sp. 39-45-136]|nr:MAG: hypothetical protein B7X60_00575 [Polynucleobacter sp. 39-45-136]
MINDENYSLALLQKEYDARQSMRDTISEVITRYIPVGGDVLELGSGLGHNLDALAANYRVLGVEVLPDAVHKASERGIETIHANLEHEINLKAESWDVVLCLDVLEHLINPIACIQEAKRLLRPSGIFVINVPNHFTLTCRIRMLLGAGLDAPNFFPEYHAWNYPHLRFFQYQSIKKTLELGGFRIIEDLSWKVPAVPFLQRIPMLKGLCCLLAKFSPNLFCGGFFLILHKSNLLNSFSK